MPLRGAPVLLRRGGPGTPGGAALRLLHWHRAPARFRAAGRADGVLRLLQARPERAAQGSHGAGPGPRAAGRGPVGDRDRRAAGRRGDGRCRHRRCGGSSRPRGSSACTAVVGPAPRLEPVRAGPLQGWPAGPRFDCDRAGLYLLMPAMAELGLDALVGQASYPDFSAGSALYGGPAARLQRLGPQGGELRAGGAKGLGGLRPATEQAAAKAKALGVDLEVQVGQDDPVDEALQHPRGFGARTSRR